MKTSWLPALAITLAGVGMAQAQAPSIFSTASNTTPHADGQGTVHVIDSAPHAPAAVAESGPGCASGSCAVEAPCVEPGTLWGNVEYLLWWIRDSRAPIVIGTAPGSLANTNPFPPGSIMPFIGGGRNVDYQEHNGGRITLGTWLDCDHVWGVNAGYFQLEHKVRGAHAASSGDPILGPVFFDPTNSLETIILFSTPGERSSTADAFSNERLWGAEANVTMKTVRVFSSRTDLLFGFRYLNFDEGFTSTATTTITQGPPQDIGFGISVFDRFGTHNQFYAPQVGFVSDYKNGAWDINLGFRFAMGCMHETARIDGGTTFITPGQPDQHFVGGVLAQPTNIGHYEHNKFAVLPEVTLTLGYQVTNNIRAFFGYNYLYVSSLARAGSTIDTTVTPTQIHSLAAFDPNAPPATRPVFRFHGDDFWAQGLTFGAEIRY